MRVDKALKTLPNTYSFSIQQRTIIGDPDKLICIGGKFVALELKSEQGEPTKLQLHKLAAVKKAGGISLVAYPKNWPEVFTILSVLASKGIGK